MHFSLPYVVHPEDMTRWVLHGVTNVEQQKQFNREFCAFLNGQDIACLNLTDDLIDTARQKTERLYYWLDIHWTEGEMPRLRKWSPPTWPEARWLNPTRLR